MPLAGSRIAAWYKNAKQIKDEKGLAMARGWIRKHVPEQFQEVIERNMRLSK
jgi:hypothetical protein